jgi:hypothetical protein
MHQSYGNRALAYLKKKGKLYYYIEFIKCLDDCEKALAICPTYTKALHRKAKALINLSIIGLTKREKYKPIAFTNKY